MTRKPSTKDEANIQPFQHRADLRPATMDDDRIDAGLLHQNDVLREFPRHAAVHGVPAIFHDDGFVVVFEDEWQCFDQHAGGCSPARKPAQIAFARAIVLHVHAIGPLEHHRSEMLYQRCIMQAAFKDHELSR